jgi:hypothetical protein
MACAMCGHVRAGRGEWLKGQLQIALRRHRIDTSAGLTSNPALALFNYNYKVRARNERRRSRFPRM